jgi:hypothetical protein
MLHRLFFQTMSSNSLTDKIEETNKFGRWLVDLDHCAGFSVNISVYNFRAETFVKADSMSSLIILTFLSVGTNFSIDNSYSVDERMKFAEHSNCDIFFKSYMPQISTVDSQSSY